MDLSLSLSHQLNYQSNVSCDVSYIIEVEARRNIWPICEEVIQKNGYEMDVEKKLFILYCLIILYLYL